MQCFNKTVKTHKTYKEQAMPCMLESKSETQAIRDVSRNKKETVDIEMRENKKETQNIADRQQITYKIESKSDT